MSIQPMTVLLKSVDSLDMRNKKMMLTTSSIVQHRQR